MRLIGEMAGCAHQNHRSYPIRLLSGTVQHNFSTAAHANRFELFDTQIVPTARTLGARRCRAENDRAA